MKALLILVLLAVPASADWMIRSDSPATLRQITAAEWQSGQPGLTVKGWRLTSPPPAPTPEETAAADAAATAARRDNAYAEYEGVLQQLAAVRIALELHPGVARLTQRRAALLSRESALWQEITAP